MSKVVSFKNLCLCVTRVYYLSGFVEFLCLKPKRSTRHGQFDREGGTEVFSCVKVFDFIDIYLCFIAGVCERERRFLPHSAYHISGAISPLCVCTVQRFCRRPPGANPLL